MTTALRPLAGMLMVYNTNSRKQLTARVEDLILAGDKMAHNCENLTERGGSVVKSLAAVL